MAVCFRLTHFPFDGCRNICTSSHYHHQMENMNHYPLLRDRIPMVCAICILYVQFPFGKLKGLPYIPSVHLSEGSSVRRPLKWLWSQPVVRMSFIPKFRYSESCYVPKIPYSERPSTIWILCYEGSLVRSSSGPKGAMFRTSIFRKSPLPHTSSTLRRSFSPKFPPF